MTTYFRSYQPRVTTIVAQGTLPSCQPVKHEWGPTKRIGTRYRARQCRVCGRKETTYVR